MRLFILAVKVVADERVVGKQEVRRKESAEIWVIVQAGMATLFIEKEPSYGTGEAGAGNEAVGKVMTKVAPAGKECLFCAVIVYVVVAATTKLLGVTEADSSVSAIAEIVRLVARLAEGVEVL